LRKLLFIVWLGFGAALQGAAPTWLDQVAPIISPAERKAYVGLSGDARRDYEEKFWSNKSITGEEYFRRLQYVDSTFGSGKTGSGANTDEGRVYLAVGAPTKITRLPSSRIFVPMEIWYYDVVPGVLNTELRLIFYLKNDIGFPKLYSPTVDTIRVLLLPEAATIGMFGPNDSTAENDVRQVLKVPPAEDEVITAAANVATGIKYSGNDEILGLVTSPRAMLGRAPKTEVQSRLIVSRSTLDVFQSVSEYGGSQIDLRLGATAVRELEMEVLDGGVAVYRNQLHLNFTKAEAIQYTHRLDLLPGSYQVIFTIDGKPNTWPLDVGIPRNVGGIFRADEAEASDRRQTPFEFAGKQLDLNTNGKSVLVSLAHPEKVTWRIRRGSEAVWRFVSEPGVIALAALPKGLPPGAYTIEAATASDAHSQELVISNSESPAQEATLVSYNANLTPALRFAFIGRQWLLRGKLDEARRCLQASLDKGPTDDAQVEFARVDALSGNLDAARERVRGVLARHPDQFEALSVLAYIETKLQDYAVAADLYRHALSVQESPALRVALAKLPQQ
jgi:GWxTD domain-containing protein